MASILVISSTGYSIADTWRTRIDGALGTESYISKTDEESARFKKDYASSDELKKAARDLAVREGEEGTVIMKNDNNALPLNKANKVALFGFAAWEPYIANSGDLKAGNPDAVKLYDSLENAGFKLEETVKDIYWNDNTGIAKQKTETPGSSGTTVSFDYGYASSPGDLSDYKINEVSADGLVEVGAAKADWKSRIVKSETVGICVFARSAGEGNMYKNDDGALDWKGNATHKDPLALSEDELSIIDAAKETCSKVIVLINSGNNMEIGEIAKGGAHEVDAIGYIGVVNDYQCEGIVNVLSGKVNSTGAMADTYVYDNTSLPAMMNINGDEYADADIANSAKGADNRWPEEELVNIEVDSFGGGRFELCGRKLCDRSREHLRRI